jgi:hypothetical protein
VDNYRSFENAESLEDTIIDITPPVQIYDYFKKLSYEPKYALAEFIDNSSQSFFDHEHDLRDAVSVTHVNPHVVIKIDIRKDSITIEDNAYGMDLEDFKRAVQLMKPPKNQGGRNEFGMGLKTAACWFGDRWTVSSTRKGDINRYTTTVDIKEIARNDLHSVNIKTDIVSEGTHGTTIQITNLSHEISHGNTINKLQRDITSMYRQDIRNKKVKIIMGDSFNDSPLSYKEPEPLEDQGIVYKKSVDFKVDNEAVNIFNTHNPDFKLDLGVTGFVGVLHQGNTSGAGFTLLRRGRVIEDNYRPEFILGKANDFAQQRIYGELHLDGFPVSQAKDKFDWSLGIEDDFISTLNEYVGDYVKVARKYRKRKRVDATKIIEGIESSIAGVDSIERISIVESKIQPEVVDRGDRDAAEIGVDNDVEIQGPKSWDIEVFLSNNNNYLVAFTYDDTRMMENWLDITIESCNPKSVTCNLNTRHAFFRPYISKPDFIRTLSELAISLCISELEARRISNSANGKVEPSAIRLGMNDILNSIKKGGADG